MKKKILIAGLVILIAVGLVLYNFYSQRRSIGWQMKPLESKPVKADQGQNRLQDTLYLNETFRNFDLMETDPHFKLDAFPVDLSTVSVMSGKADLEGGTLKVKGKQIVLGLWGIKPLILEHEVNLLQLDLGTNRDIVVDTFGVFRRNSFRRRAREFIRQLFTDRFGSFIHQVELGRQNRFQMVSIQLDTRSFQKKKETIKAIVIKIKNPDNQTVRLRLKGISFHSESNSKLRRYPSLSYFKSRRRWIKSLFFPPRSRFFTTIHASKPLVVDGYLGAFEKQRVGYRITLNGEPTVEKTVTDDLVYFKAEARPRQGKIQLGIEVSGGKNSAGIIGNLTFYRKKPGRKNIVYYLTDALRSDFGGLNQSLFKEHFREGAIFTNAYANATNTGNSLPVIFSGKYKFMLVTYMKDSPFLPRGEFLLAEYLKTRGYTTAAFVANPWLVRTNSHQGFDHLYDCWGKVRDLPLFPDTREYIYFKYGKMWEFLQRFVDQNRDKPLFLYIHTIEPHMPYELPREMRHHSKDLDEKVLESVHGDFKRTLKNPSPDQVHALKSLYRDGVLRAYHFFVKTTAFLKEKGIIQNRSLRIFSADHGERFFEHRAWGHGIPDVYNEVTRVPLMAVGPGFEPGTYAHNVNLADIYPTIIDWLGDRVSQEMVGESLLKYIKGKIRDFPNRVIYSDGTKRSFQYSYIKGNIKVIVDDRETEIYDLARDPGEKIDLSGEARFQALIREARTHRENFKVTARKGRRVMSAEERKRLKSLGYID